MAQLFRQFLGDQIDGRVELMTVILRVQVRPGEGEVDLDDKRMLGFAFIMPDGHVGPDDFAIEVLQVAETVKKDDASAMYKEV